MPIRINCPSCMKVLNAPDDAAGEKCRCPRCGNRFQLPEADTEDEEPQVSSQAWKQRLLGWTIAVVAYLIWDLGCRQNGDLPFWLHFLCSIVMVGFVGFGVRLGMGGKATDE